MRTRIGRWIPAALALAACASSQGGTPPDAAPAPATSQPDPTPDAAPAPSPSPSPKGADAMELGAFSVSLAVKDLGASRAFYEKLGFSVVGGEAAQNWLILRNGTTTIGLFQGMFERNLLTFNPGWSWEAKPLPSFRDIREIQKTLTERGLQLVQSADPASTGPASCVLTDPDGNPILLDQHVPRK